MKSGQHLPNKKPEQMFLPSQTIRKSNALCRASWHQDNVYEARLIALVASQIKTTDTDFQTYEIPLVDIFQGIRNPSQKDYDAAENLADKLFSRPITMHVEKGWCKYNIFSSIRYNKEKNTFTVKFDPDLKPHYLELKKYFAQYQLIEFLLLPSTYSQRIFEILKSWESQPEVTIPIEDLHTMLETPKSYQSFKDFKKWVLKPAHKNITEKTSLKYEWEALKVGVRVAAVRFTFGKQAIKQVEAKKRQKKSARDTLLFKQAIACHSKKNGDCAQDLHKEGCALCIKLLQKT